MTEHTQNGGRQGSIFWIEVEKIYPNPMQPRREFDESKLAELADSIKQYGVLQPLVVVRQEQDVPTGINVVYELIAGERRWRASKLAGIGHVPAVIREEPAEKVKLELALVENVQREDLNSIERAKAFKQLANNFNLSHKEIASRVGKSREFVSNTMRLLVLPDYIQQSISEGRLSEGHARSLLMLADQPDEQEKLLNDILYRNVSVRQSERYARRIAVNRVRKREDLPDSETREFEDKLREALGTRVSIERKGLGGKISIEFFSEQDLRNLIEQVAREKAEAKAAEQQEKRDTNENQLSPSNREDDRENIYDETPLSDDNAGLNVMTAKAREGDLDDFTL